MSENTVKKSWIAYIKQKLVSNGKVFVAEIASTSGTSPEKLKEYIEKEILRKGHLKGALFTVKQSGKHCLARASPRDESPQGFPKGKLAICACVAVSIVITVVLAQQQGLIPGLSPPKHGLHAMANVGEAYWTSDDGGQPVAVHEVAYTVYNRETEQEIVTLTLFVNGSPQSLGTVSIPEGSYRSGAVMVKLREGHHSIQLFAKSAKASAQAQLSLPRVSFAQWPSEVRMPPKLSVAVNAPSIMYLGYENSFAVSISNSGGPAYANVRAGSYEYTIRISAGETKTLEVPQVADDLDDGYSNVYYSFSVEVSASNAYGGDAENGLAQARVVQKPVEIWYSPPELEERQSFGASLADFFAGMADVLSGRLLHVEFSSRYVGGVSSSVSRMVYLLNCHDNSIMNLKEIYYFVRDYIDYDDGKARAWYLGIGQTFGFSAQYPVETLKLQKGICLDKAALLASILEHAGFDAALVYTSKGLSGHVFAAVYLPGYPGDHPAPDVRVPYGSPGDWLYLDAVSKGIRFGEDWTHREGFGGYKIVDVGLGSVAPSLKVADAYWTKDNVRISSAKVGENVRANMSLIATGGAVSGIVEIRVRKAWVLWLDEDYRKASFEVAIPRSGEIQTIGTTFAPDMRSGSQPGGGVLDGYYIEVYSGGKKIYSMRNEYPPRLRVSS